MRAVRSEEGRPKVVDVPEPSGDGVMVRVASAGICGSDQHMLGFGLPTTFGHEFAGLLPDGTPVAVEPIAPCGVCDACRVGDLQLCVLGASMAFGVGRDGGMAEYCLAPASSITLLPSGLDPSVGCLVEPIAVAVHGIRRGGVRGSHRVAVIGGGTIVVEAAGTDSALAQAANICRPGGTIIGLGTYWHGTVQMPGLAMGMKELNFVPAVMYGRSGPSRDFDVAATLLAHRPEVADALITHRFPLDAAVEAFEVARDRAAGAIKVVLEP